MRVGIIGAGIGGLCAAIGLQRAGARVEVFERAAAPRVAGSGLSVFGNGIAALDAIGVGDRFRAATDGAATMLRAGQRRPDGAWLVTIPPEGVTSLRIVHRADLHELLLSALQPGTVRWATSVDAVSDDAVLTLGDGRVERFERFDLVVAADGIRSAVRSSWPGDPGIRYSGYSTWRGITARPVDLGGAAGETWGDGLRFGLAPLPDGRVYWFAVASMPADAVIADEFAEVVRLFGSWHDPIPELLAATDPVGVFRLPIEDLAGPAPTFRRGRVVLLGDAAHAMTPDLGQGGGQAMEDAATLAALLAPLAAVDAPDGARVDAALARYDVERRRRTQPIARRARLLGAVAHGRGPVRVALRDAVLRMTPGSALARQARTIQSWQPPVL